MSPKRLVMSFYFSLFSISRRVQRGRLNSYEKNDPTLNTSGLPLNFSG